MKTSSQFDPKVCFAHSFIPNLSTICLSTICSSTFAKVFSPYAKVLSPDVGPQSYSARTHVIAHMNKHLSIIYAGTRLARIGVRRVLLSHGRRRTCAGTRARARCLFFFVMTAATTNMTTMTKSHSIQAQSLYDSVVEMYSSNRLQFSILKKRTQN